ncbi:hypothetical protein BLOT_015371 [Blomia tropicalis]|nr:hypothetical protein BLOT_015371 [Blomia tropicalis]
MMIFKDEDDNYYDDDDDYIFKPLTHTLTRLRSPVVQVESIYLVNPAMVQPNQEISYYAEKRKECSKIQDISTLHITHIMNECNLFFILITKPETCSII